MTTLANFNDRRRRQAGQNIRAASVAREVETRAEFLSALHDALTSDLRAIHLLALIPVTEEVQVEGLRRALVIDGLGVGGLVNADDYAGNLLRLGPDGGSAETYQRPPWLELRAMALRCAGDAVVGEGATRMLFRDIEMQAPVGASGTRLASGDFRHVEVRGGSFTALDVEAYDALVFGARCGDIDLASGGTTGDRATLSVFGCTAGDITLTSSSADAHATVSGNVARTPKNLDVSGFAGSYSEAANENYTVVP